MTDAKELVERLRAAKNPSASAGFFNGKWCVKYDDVIPSTEEASAWIERWAPVVEAAQQYARSKKIMQTFDASLPNTEHLVIECFVEARERLLSAAAALKEDKP